MAWQAFIENGCLPLLVLTQLASDFGTYLHLASQNSLLQYHHWGAWQSSLK